MKQRGKDWTNGATAWPGLLLLLLLVVPLLSLLLIGNRRKKMITLNPESGEIYRLLLSAGFNSPFSKWILALSAHETGNFTSWIYKKNFNAFGIKYQGQVTALGEKNGHAYYNSYQDSVNDFKRLYKSYGIVSVAKLESWVSYLKEMGYYTAPESEYFKGVNFFYNLYFPNGELDPSIPMNTGSF